MQSKNVVTAMPAGWDWGRVARLWMGKTEDKRKITMRISLLNFLGTTHSLAELCLEFLISTADWKYLSISDRWMWKELKYL